MHRKTVIDFRALGERYTFTQPIKELKTRDLAEVTDLLDQVQSYQEQAWKIKGLETEWPNSISLRYGYVLLST